MVWEILVEYGKKQELLLMLHKLFSELNSGCAAATGCIKNATQSNLEQSTTGLQTVFIPVPLNQNG
jgi:hypothetical protein